MKDLIDRQEAIRAFDDAGFCSHGYIVDVLKGLPSAQPTYTDEEIQKMQDLESAEIEKAYQLGYEDGKKDAQPVTDCISRQAAIDALNVLCQEHRYRIPGKRETYSPYNEAWQDALDRAEGAIFNLPSAQFATDTNVGDKISRQAAIDTLTRLEPSFRGSVLEQALKNMPSAQPEIIRCKDCKYAKWDDECGDYICDGRAVWKNHYCGYAKRKGESDGNN